MSCGQNRRRKRLSSTFESRKLNSNESSSNKTKLKENNYLSLSKRKGFPIENLSKEKSSDTEIDFNRFHIFDDEGHDVTPRPITDYRRINVSKNFGEDKSSIESANKRFADYSELSMSDRSILRTTNITNSKSYNIHTNMTFSMGDKTIFDVNTQIKLENEYFQNKINSDRLFFDDIKNDESQAKFLAGIEVKSVDLLNDSVTLSETETIFVLDINGDIVSYDNQDMYNRIIESNKAYIEMCQNRKGNDLYVDRGMQTFSNPSKHESNETDIIFTKTQQSWANTWDIYNSTVNANQYQGKIYREYMANTNENLINNNTHLDEKKSIQSNSRMTSCKSSKSSSTYFSQNSLAMLISSKANCIQTNDRHTTKLPEVDVDGFVMERILNLCSYQFKQRIYSENRIPITNNEYSDRKDLSWIENRNVILEYLWDYKCHLTLDRNVSCLIMNENNQDLLIVGYGKFQYNDDKEGIVCCWNAKNPEFPERYYQTDAGVTSLALSSKRCNLLAVGLFNGSICIFDLNQNNTPPVINTSIYDKKHTGPVWQLTWIEPDRSPDMNSIEILVSISGDGRVTQWTLRKELEATDLMFLKSYHRSEKNDQTYMTGHISDSVGGLCLDIRPNDKTIYLFGTDDGFIHRCSTIYNEKYLETYSGHTAAVYKVHWSPFVDDIFLSASADWTIRLWMVGYQQPFITFSTNNSKIFYDAMWSPKSSTVFFCVSENAIQIWDLLKSTLDPIYVVNCADNVTFTSIICSADSKSISVGTSTGEILVYYVENLFSVSNGNDLLRIVQQNLPCEFDDALEGVDPRPSSSLTSIESEFMNDH